MKTVYVGMSGGVDSSVAALLLREQGYKVVGVYMKNWSQDLPGMKCPWAEDLADAKRVAVKLGIDFEVWDFEEAYREKVVEYMLDEFRKGNTPNPDIMCNQEIKFKLFYEKAMEAGADYIATGHYARVLGGPWTGPATTSSPTSLVPLDSAGVPQAASPVHVTSATPSVHINLGRALDENKDQTYFLYRISEEALSHTIFPIGEMRKPEVKKLAEERGLHNAYKKESMGVCFVGEVGMKDFLKEYIEVEPGEIREIESERVLGYHEGAVFYTIGQRHGLYLDGEKGVVNDGMPYYVVKKDVKNNIVYVSKNLNNERLWTDELRLKDVFMRMSDTAAVLSELWTGPATDILGSRWTGPAATSSPTSLAPLDSAGDPQAASPVHEAPTYTTPARATPSPSLVHEAHRETTVLVRLRHRAPLIPATFDGERLHFESKIKRPASGQSAVLYDGEICLGGGIIA